LSTEIHEVKQTIEDLDRKLVQRVETLTRSNDKILEMLDRILTSNLECQTRIGVAETRIQALQETRRNEAVQAVIQTYEKHTTHPTSLPDQNQGHQEEESVYFNTNSYIYIYIYIYIYMYGASVSGEIGG